MMKIFLVTLASLFVIGQLNAADTSGCQFLKTNQEIRTVKGAFLKVEVLKASKPTCWNASQGTTTISYSWQETSQSNHAASFWTKINSQELTLATVINCSQSNIISYAYNTSGKTLYKCEAKATVITGYQESLILEVAPTVDGQWDTVGYSNNYIFRM